MKSIRVNYFYNLIITISNILFPILILPYVLRVIGASGIGKVNYATTVSSYFVMFAQFGIPFYGIKEISKVRNNQSELNTVFSEIFILNIITMLISLSLYLILFYIDTQMQIEMKLYIIMGFQIIFSLFSLDWYFNGLEEFKFISLRNLIIKFISILLIILFIKDIEHYVYYALITILAIGLSNIMNFVYFFKKSKLVIGNLSIKRHFKPLLYLLFSSLIGSIYLDRKSTRLNSSHH